MKKTYLLGISTMATLLLATSCQEQELVNPQQPSEEVKVSVKVNTPELAVATRAFGDGQTAMDLHYAVYNVKKNANGGEELTYLPELTEEDHDIKGTTTVDLQLVTGNTYKVIFWADNEKAPYYTHWEDVTNPTVTIDYDNNQNGVTCNNEDYDAFFNWMTIDVDASKTVEIDLFRPFAQLNIGTSDIVQASQAGYTLQQTQVKVKTYTTLNLWDKTVDGLTDVVVDFQATDYPNYDASAKYCLKASTVEGYETFPVQGYEYMAMTYLLRPIDKELADVEFLFYSTEDELKERTYASVPLQRNWRTNIYGQLITSDVDVNVEIVPAFEDVHNNEVKEVTTAQELQEVINDAVADIPTTIVLTDNIDLTDLLNPNNSRSLTRATTTEALLIPADKKVTIDLNGKTITMTKECTSTYSMIVNKGNLTITDSNSGGKISFTDSGNGDPTYGWASQTINNCGVLTVEDGIIENATTAMSHAMYAIMNYNGAELVVNGGQVVHPNGHAIRMASFGDGANSVTINGGYVEGTRAIQVQLPGSSSASAPEMTLTVNGGELTSNEQTYNLAVYVYSHGQSGENVTLTVNDGIINGNIALYEEVTKTMQENAATVKGGTFNGQYGIFSYASDEIANSKINVLGGEFSTLYSMAYLNSAEEKITLAEDIEIAEKSNYMTFKGHGTLDLNGKTISTGLEQEGRHYYAINNYGNLTIINNGSINARGIKNFGTMVVDGDVTITNIDTNGGAAIWNEGELTINKGTFTTNAEAGEGSYGAAVNTREGGTATINGGTYIAYSQLTYAIVNEGTTTINDAKVQGKHGAVAGSESGDKTIINGGSFELMENPGVSDHCAYCVSQIKGGRFTLGKNTDSGAKVFYESAIADGYKIVEEDVWTVVVPQTATEE